MVFQSDTYSVLVVSDSEKMNTAVRSLLPPSDFWPVSSVRSISGAKRLMLEKPCDIVIIDSPLADGNGVQFSIDLCSGSEAGVLLMVAGEIYEEVYYKALPGGVAVLSKPVSAAVLTNSVRLLCAVRERLRSVVKEQVTVEDKMKELRLINKAKWILIEREHMTEDEAHRHIGRRAMEQRISRTEVAEAVIRSHEEMQTKREPGR